ncbi:MAG TPA: methionyl-tRNA formyltransferase [Acidimicrobiia bacterium]
MRLVFFGTPDDAVPALRGLHDAGHDVVLVVTQPDRRRGRRGGLDPSPVKAAAAELGLAVRTPSRARDVTDEVANSGAEVGVVVAFGQLLPVPLFTSVPLGFVNVHFSLLPRWRGAAPVERAILAGDRETGVCIMQIEQGLDTGPVYARTSTPIGETETAGELRARLVTMGTDLLVATLPSVASTTPVPQAGEPTTADKLTVEEFELDVTRPADELVRVVRAGNPRPGAWTTVDGARLKVWRARAAADGGFDLLEVQPEGRARMSADEWLRGRRGAPVRLGS